MPDDPNDPTGRQGSLLPRFDIRGMGTWLGLQQGLRGIVADKAAEAAMQRKQQGEDFKSLLDARKQWLDEDRLTQTAYEFGQNRPSRDSEVALRMSTVAKYNREPEEAMLKHQRDLEDAITKGNIDKAVDAAKSIQELEKQHDQQKFTGQQNDLNRASALQRTRISAANSGGGSGRVGSDDVKAIADAIESGRDAPDLARLYSAAAPVRAELGRRGFDIMRANEDWQATSKFLQTMNGPQMTRLTQAIDFTRGTIPSVRGLINEWDSMGLPLLSKANMLAAQSGAKGQAAQDLANRMGSQINDMVSELAQVYRGGYAPTNEALKLAASNLQGDWSKKSANGALDQIEMNLKIRDNSIRHAAPIGGRPDNPYAPETRPDVQTGAPGSGAPAAAAAGAPQTPPREIIDALAGEVDFAEADDRSGVTWQLRNGRIVRKQ